MSSAPPVPARDRILDVAGALFLRDGFRAVGVDRLIAEAGVAKATFYRHFPAKDDVIVAWLGRAEEVTARALPPPGTAKPLTALAHVLIDLAGGDDCLGCTYQGSAAEFGDPAHPAHAAALGVKRRLLADLAVRAGEQGLRDPRAVAERVFLLLEGVWATRRMFGAEAPLGEAKDALDRLIAEA